MKFLFITQCPNMAKFAIDNGVDRIFVDLEWRGKAQRQHGRMTVINRHTLQDARSIREALPHADLMVRVNAFHQGGAEEIAPALAAGADHIMLPMVTSADEVAQACTLVAGRAGIIPLVETGAGMARLAQIVALEGVSEIYIGLNDLHLSLDLSFVFEPLAAGLVDHMAAIIKAAGKPFGFGGLARCGEGRLPAELVLAEHVRLGSDRVILSRAFHGSAKSTAELQANIDLGAEIALLRAAEARLHDRAMWEALRDQAHLQATVQSIVGQ